MKRYRIAVMLILIILLANNLKAQNFGGSIGFGTSSSFLVDLFYTQKKSAYHLGFSYQLSNTKGKLISEQKANYGRTIDGTGEFFWTIDIGYGYYFKKKISLNGEVSIGSQNEFTNYIDRRFNGGGYHMIDESQLIAGIGGNIGYNFTDSVNGFVGYNTIRELSLGIRFTFFPTGLK